MGIGEEKGHFGTLPIINRDKSPRLQSITYRRGQRRRLRRRGVELRKGCEYRRRVRCALSTATRTVVALS